LRYLFIVHASLAEFELAFKAYESYVEIVTRGKDRVEKSGEVDVNIDSDSTVLRTSAEAIRLLCRFGSKREAEKALEIGHSIERWLDQSEHIRSTAQSGSVASADTALEPAALTAAYCAIGISQAHWARHTYDVELRADFQSKAAQYLRKALSPNLGDSNDVEALYALALVLAEMRDIPGAIKTVKRALSPKSSSQATISTDGVLSGGLASDLGRERKLIPLWHLLALLLTSRADFAAAEKACEAAFEQFGDLDTLFGNDGSGAYHSEHLNQTTGHHGFGPGIVDRMEGFEKTSILQIKMTQLALMETLEGSVYAVDGCDELLALYGRLFGDPAGEATTSKPPVTSMPPPKSAVGTVRGSVFRGRGSVKTSQKELPTRTSSVLSSGASTSATHSGGAPAIQVTEEDGTTHANGHQRHHLFHHHKHDDNQTSIGRSSSKLQKRTSASLRRQSISGADRTPDVPVPSQHVSNGAAAQSQRKSNEAGERPLRAIPHNMSHTEPPHEHLDEPPKQDVRLPAPAPHANYVRSEPRFPKIQERRQKVSLLVDIWLFISGLYSRAHMFHDAKEAIAEALKLVENFEVEISIESSTAKALGEKGWGGGKSVEELWADAFTAVSIHLYPRMNLN
jgi:tetratricopeptide (TPR) repeat protein